LFYVVILERSEGSLYFAFAFVVAVALVVAYKRQKINPKSLSYFSTRKSDLQLLTFATQSATTSPQITTTNHPKISKNPSKTTHPPRHKLPPQSAKKPNAPPLSYVSK
jgi:hypothetical protein